MKRDMDLVRLILMQMEDDEAPADMSTYSEDQILYHCGLVIQAGLVEGKVVEDNQGNIRGAAMQRLTWAGHDFLDAARNDAIWKKAREKIVSIGGAWTIEILKALLLHETKVSLGIASQ
jgi:hypothetical protein